jgi:hypothetical protein
VHRIAEKDSYNFQVATPSSMALFDARFKNFRWWCKSANLRGYADVRFRKAVNAASVTGMGATRNVRFRPGTQWRLLADTVE